MLNQKNIYTLFFKAQDQFLNRDKQGFDVDIIQDYVHWGKMLACLHREGSDHENTLLSELFLQQVFSHLLQAINDDTRTLIFRKICLDNIYIPLLCLKRHYYRFNGGHSKVLALQNKLNQAQISLDPY